MSPDLPIPASAIEAAARAIWHRQVEVVELDEVEAALRAAFDELGMEYQRVGAGGEIGLLGMREAEANLRPAEGSVMALHDYHRLVSRWMPVEKS